MRFGPLLAAITLFVTLGLGSFPSEAIAGGNATVSVEVVKGTKGGSGVDDKVKKHAGTLGSFGDYGAWKSAGNFSLKLDIGNEGSKSVGSRNFKATLVSLSADKAKTRVVVVDPNGKEHATTINFSNGAQTVLTSKSSDGKEMHVFVVRVAF